MLRTPSKRPPQLPKVMACMSKPSLETMRNKKLFMFRFYDAKQIRRYERRQVCLHECLILELYENGFIESSNYLRDLIHENLVIVDLDEIGVVIDLRDRSDYLEHIAEKLKLAEKSLQMKNPVKECLVFRNLALHYAELGKGILWLAEKFYLTATAVASKYHVDGGRLKGCCKYLYAKFLLDKFPEADSEEPYKILYEVREMCLGKTWSLWQNNDDYPGADSGSLIVAVALQSSRVLLKQSRAIRKTDVNKSERLARLAEKRAAHGDSQQAIAEAVKEVGFCQQIRNNLNTATKSFSKALRIYTVDNNVDGICEMKMHLAAVMKKLGRIDEAAEFLTDMGYMAMHYRLMKHLGRSLHLLGELYLYMDQPQVATQLLREAFICFVGIFSDICEISQEATDTFAMPEYLIKCTTVQQDRVPLSEFYDHKRELYIEEAEQSRLMAAVSQGQELAASYYSLLKEADTCLVATEKAIDWKLGKNSWWIHRPHHDFVPCPCPMHQRTLVDIYSLKQEALQVETDRILKDDEEKENFSLKQFAHLFASNIGLSQQVVAAPPMINDQFLVPTIDEI